jgi:glycolate oxidase
MALSKEIYQAFEDIVGPENISDDPAVLDSYRYPLTHTAIHIGPWYGVFTPRGQAVLLPGNTEEVQAIVKLCNKYEIKFKASSTFWSARGNISYDYGIAIDMRRMDRILEIDEKNMFAVVEPYVCYAQLQAEAMKVGLNTNIKGAGCSCSVLAGTCALGGGGAASYSIGTGWETLLGMEWVTPGGEVIRTGSLGSGLNFFCPEGPGPSLTGIARGGGGTMGALGIFTKCAVKLGPWPGPAGLPTEGIVPAYKAVLPRNIRAHTLVWPSWQAYADGVYKIWDAEIGYLAHRQYAMFGGDHKGAMIRILTDPTKTLSDLEEMDKDPEIIKQTEEMKHCDFQFILAGMTMRDIEWQEKVLDKILADTGGWKASLTEEPEVEKWSLVYMLRLGHKNLNLVYGGGYDGAFGLGGTPDYGTKHVEEVSEFKRKWEEEKGTIVQTGGDSIMSTVQARGDGPIGWEQFVHFDPYSKESTEGACAYFDASSKFSKERGLGGDMGRGNAMCRGSDGYAIPKEEHERMLSGGEQTAVFNYQWKIREAFNPNDLGDQYYMTVEPKK